MQVKEQVIGQSDSNLSDLSVNSPQMRRHALFCLLKSPLVEVIAEWKL